MRPVLLVAVAFLLPACGGEEGANDAAAPAGAADVEIVLADFTVEPSSLELAPGSYTFSVVNEGGQTHALEIEGPNGEVETGDLAPGESAELAVDLSEPGEYEVYCPVGGHRGQGMEGTITVGGAGAPATTTDETTTDEDSDYRY
ncbi:MAG TPA: cupredoxin domain-containing protein [Gaiellaceae bacterium]|nr:cupredoxin domain-containing protein [Gaiellaceae bacterium]